MIKEFPFLWSDAPQRGYIAVIGKNKGYHFLWYAPDSGNDFGVSQSPRTSKILYIEDDFNNAQLMKRVLEADGYSVSLASNGAIGLDKANREHPDLILLDIYMAGLNGHEVARRLRQMKDTKDIPILVVSASPNAGDKRLSKEAGCNGYIAKPIAVDEISDQVAAYL